MGSVHVHISVCQAQKALRFPRLCANTLDEYRRQIGRLCDRADAPSGLSPSGQSNEEGDVNQLLVKPRAMDADLPVLPERISKIRGDNPGRGPVETVRTQVVNDRP